MKAGQPNNRDDGLLSNLRYRRKWKKVTSVLSIFVAVGTISSLMLPAITLNKDACGEEAHTHAAECYSVTTEQVLNCSYDTLGIHRHSSDCQDEDGNTRCSQVDFVVHTHDSTCYQSDGSLSCFLKEIEEHFHEDSCYQATEVAVDSGHSHGDGCYEWVKSETPTCETQESSGHQHGDSCYATGTELLCTETEHPGHAHGDTCYELADSLICTQEEVAEHSHSDECFDENGIVLCGYEESSGHTHGTDCFAQTSQLVCLTEEASGHTHSSECYAASGSLLCTEEETPSHQHSEECYGLVKGDLICNEEEREPVIEAGEPELICKEPEVLLHTHKGTCYEYDDQGNPVSLVCGMPEVTEHQHTGACFAEKEVHTLVCEIPEHTHTEACSGSSELTEEEQAQVDGLILAIDSLPSPEEVTAQLALFDEAGDTAGRDAYTAALLEQIAPVFGQYGALTEKQKSAVTNAAALMALEWLMPEEETLPALTEEEQAQVDDVIFLIDTIPPVLEIQNEIARLESSGETEALVAYREKVISAVKSAFDAYDALNDVQKAAVTNAGSLEEYTWLLTPESTTIETTGDGYVLSVSYRADAALPTDTIVAAKTLTPDSTEYQNHLSQIEELLFNKITRNVWIYDISLQYEGTEIEPSAAVTIQMALDQPHTPAENSTFAVVHFTSEGPELLEVNTVETDGNVTGFVHEQSSFSVTAYVELIPNPNPTEVGPDPLSVDYYIYLDGAWKLVGSTKTGWLAPEGSTGWATPDVRDAISLAQIESIFGAYGFDPANANAVRTVAYHRTVATSAYSDTDKATRDGYDILPLSRDGDYNLYFLPNLPTYSGLNDSKKLPSTAISSLPTAENAFYTLNVLDANHVVYNENETLPESQTALVKTTRNLTVKTAAGGWQWVGADGLVTEADGTDNADGTTTYTSPTVTQTLYLSPVSSVLNGSTTSQKTVHWMVYLDDEWKEVGTTSVIYKRSNLVIGAAGAPRWFVTSDQAYSILADYGFDPAAYQYTDNTSNSFGHQANGPAVDSGMYTDGNSTLLSDGKTWAIGLSYDEQDYTLYYIPGYAGKSLVKGVTPNEFRQTASNMDGSRFYSISIRDDDHLVYAAEELEGTTVIVPEGGSAVFTVHNADNILWSSTGQVCEPEQADNKTTFSFTDIRQKIEVVATATNPNFTVQYYADIEKYDLSSSGDLSIIDTSGRKLPQNGTSPDLKYLKLENTDLNTDQNHGTQTLLHSVKTKTERIELYTEEDYQYEESPGLKYFDKLYKQPNYKLSAVCVLKEDKAPNSKNENDWWWYLVDEAGTNVTFTNVASEENSPQEEGIKQPSTGTYCILIQDGTVIRLQYETTDHSYTNQAAFYDYDISRGESGGYVLMRAVNDNGSTGINSAGNYHASRDGNSDWSVSGDGSHTHNGYYYWCENMYAFGNANCYTGVGKATWNGQTLNQYNNGTFKGCTFGLVTGLDSSGKVIWDSRITAPNVFSEGVATGKTDYPRGSLTFKQVGDTYTLTTANSTVGSRSELEYFFNPSPGSGTTHTHIFTNNFWVVDNATNRKDGNWGRWGSNANSGTPVCDKQAKGWTNGNNYIQTDTTANLPLSDDGRDHNWFFGMEFGLTFNLTEDYVGPMDYIFFGDDDLWVFLDGKLICDIGGVHSSVGEYVNLRDYLPEGSSGQHTLKFFYTERGASGSTCWMSFTLPSVSADITSQDTGSLSLQKDILDANGNDLNSQYAKQEYEFEIALKTSKGGDSLHGAYSYKQESLNGNTAYANIRDGSTVTLRAGDKITIHGLPTGTWYSITETEGSRNGYVVSVNDSSGYIVSGSVETGQTAKAKFVNTAMARLPDTGGIGTSLYTFSGWAMMIVACALMYKTRKKRKGAR